MMKMLLKNLWFSAVIVLLLPAALPAQLTFEKGTPPSMDELASIQERYLYNVRYGFFNLGEIEVIVTPDTTWQGMELIHLRTIMRSNSRIPLVGERDVHYQSFSGYTEEWPFSYQFWRDDMHSEEYDRYKIIFDRDAGEVIFHEYAEPTDTLALEEPASGGDVIFLYARQFAGTDQGYQLPVYIDDEQGSVTASNSPQIEQRSYDAFPEPIDTYYSEGVADIDGPFGFTGNFRAWFATDDLRIPLEAHVRVLFGNVRVSLIDYERIE